MTFTPYLHFQGDCAEALAFYAEVFGTDAPEISRYSDAPEGSGLPAGEGVMHGEIRLGDAVLMASDFPPGIGDPQAAVSVMHSVADPETGRAIFEALAVEGGAIVEPWSETFFARGFGMVRDRFGTHWIIHAGHP